MAGETKGVAYEALTKLVLEDLKAEGKLKGRIFWGEKPDDMTIQPDLTIGSSANAPEVNLLITHSGSAKNSDMKFWRNMGELVESKVFLPSPPKVFNLAFDSVIKEDLKKAQEASFDGQLLVGDQTYGDDLQTWINMNLKGFPKEREDKVEYLRKVASKDKELRRFIGHLKTDLEALLKKKPPKDLDAIWEMERKRKKGTAPPRKVTFVRRGLCKLLIFEDVEVALRLFAGHRVLTSEVPGYVFKMGLATKAVGRSQPSDEEASNFVSLLSESTMRDVLANIEDVTTQGFWSQIKKVRNAEVLDTLVSFVQANHASLSSKDGMLRALREQHRDPANGLQIPAGLAPPTNVWIFDIVGTLAKACADKAQDFGYSTFSKLGEPRKTKVGKMWLGDWCSCFINQYFARANSFNPPEEAIEHVARVLSEVLAQIDPSAIPGIRAKIIERYAAKEYEATLLAHRGIEPLLACIRAEKIRGSKVKLRAAFGERADLQGSSTKTTVLKSKSTLINWQSAHHSHTNDKKKELCGRAVALRYSWDAAAKKFIPRPGVKKLILVVDGTWKQSDLDALVRSGWDEIYYPDEMDKLAKAIV
jgi:hypothetical protein